jgi:glycosyltransferase involved in cell wall biosynthesis
MLETKLDENGIDVLREIHIHPFWPIILDIIRYDIDVLHLHWTHPYFIFGNLSKFENTPIQKIFSTVASVFFVFQIYLSSFFCSTIVWTVHNRVNHERQYESLDLWVSNQLASIVDTVQVWDTNTKEEISNLLDIPNNKIILVPHGNYSPIYDVTNNCKLKRDISSKIDPKKRLFLYFGRIREYKQVPRLLSTWKDLDTSDAQIIIAGSSKDEEITEQIRSIGKDDDRIILDLRYIPDKEVPAYFTACDVAVFPYSKIFNSGSVLLAMTFGIPFVAPNMGSIPSVDPNSNFIYDSNGHGLQDELARVLSADDLTLNSIGEENRSVALSEYNWDDIVDQLITAYQK